MLLSDHLPREAVLLLPSVRTRQDLFPMLSDALCRAHGLDLGGKILAGVLEREAKMSTAVGQGIAIPHARLEEVPGFLAAAALCPSGLDFPAPDGEPVRLVFLLVSSPATAGLHVRALAAVGRTCPARVRELLACADADEFLARLRAGECGASGIA